MSALVFERISPIATVSISKSMLPPSPFNFNSGANIVPISVSEILRAWPLAKIFMLAMSADALKFNFAACVFNVASMRFNTFSPSHENGRLKLKGTSIILA